MSEEGTLTYSIVIPVFNSEPIVEKTVSHIVEVMERNGIRFEILLVNDGSKDRSWEKIQGLAERMSGSSPSTS